MVIKERMESVMLIPSPGTPRSAKTSLMQAWLSSDSPPAWSDIMATLRSMALPGSRHCSGNVSNPMALSDRVRSCIAS